VPLRRSPDVAWQSIGDETVVMDLAGRRVLGLNPTGGLVWSLLEELDETSLAGAVAERFSVEPARAREDVREFLASLLARGLVREA
jgi:hypothetical protein